jgi:hypothetical protein
MTLVTSDNLLDNGIVYLLDQWAEWMIAQT